MPEGASRLCRIGGLRLVWNVIVPRPPVALAEWNAGETVFNPMSSTLPDLVFPAVPDGRDGP